LAQRLAGFRPPVTAPARTVLVLVDLVQDLDVLLPILIGVKGEPRLRADVRVSRWLARRAPRIPRLLRAAGLEFSFIDRAAMLKGAAPGLGGADLLLTASESSAGPHRWVHAVVQRAAAEGLATFTVQHGLDNLEVLVGGARHIASGTLFCWPPQAHFPAGLDAETRARLLPVGRPAPPSAAEPVFDIGVFENLHAASYSDAMRQAFVSHLVGLAQARPDLRIFARSHPAGGWLDAHRRDLGRLRNLTLVTSAAARRSSEHPAASVQRAVRIITTPSTVALDAAQSGRPVALAFEGGDLYAPLPVLDGPDAWAAFVAAPVSPTRGLADFVARHVLPGDPVARILARLTTP
jgi:hypothetical protein